MKKQKRIFLLVFTGLLLVLSLGITSMYDRVESKSPDEQVLKNFIEGDMRMLSIAGAKQLDPKYEFVSFDKRVPKDVQEKVRDDIDTQIERIMYLYRKDKDLIFSIKNTKTNKEIAVHTDRVKDSSNVLLKQTWNYNDKGLLDTGKNLINNAVDLSDMQIGYNITTIYKENEDGDTFYDEGTEAYYINNKEIPTEWITFHTPTNIQIEFTIPKDMSRDGYYGGLLNSFDMYAEFIAFTLTVASIVIMLFLAFYPIRVVQEVHPFKTTKSWKLGINVIVLTGVVSLLGTGLVALSGITLNGALADFMNEYKVPAYGLLIFLGNLALWMLTLLSIAVCIFQLKYIFTSGFSRYMREDTIIGSLIRYAKHQVNGVWNVDLKEPMTWKLFKFFAIHAVILCIISTFWIFSYPIIIIYALVCFVWTLNKINRIKKDYSRLKTAVSELGQGSFTEDINEDVGIFNSLKDDFRHIKVNFEKAVEEETKSQNMKTELISNVSHDLKTPLTCIKNYVVLLESDELSDEQRHEYLDNLNQYIRRLTTLIEDLFDVSKVNSGNMKLDLMKINIVALMEQSIAECQDLLDEKGLQVIRQVSADDIELTLDGNKTYRIFENLLTNTGKYAMGNSRVYVDIKEKEKEVVVEVKNISAEQMNFTEEEIVDRFVRGDKSRHEQGSGLGLAIVKSFTEVQGGKFHINIDGDLFKAILIFPKDKESVE